MLSATIERMTQMSSMRPATLGNSSLTSMPLWPCLPNLNGDGRQLVVRVRTSFGCSNGSGLPVLGEGRLGVEEIDVRRPAGHEEEDDALGLRLEHRRLDGQRVVGVGGAGVVGGEQAGEADHAEAVGEGAQCLAAVDGRQ